MQALRHLLTRLSRSSSLRREPDMPRLSRASMQRWQARISALTSRIRLELFVPATPGTDA
jgi:hypothetical protein